MFKLFGSSSPKNPAQPEEVKPKKYTRYQMDAPQNGDTTGDEKFTRFEQNAPPAQRPSLHVDPAPHASTHRAQQKTGPARSGQQQRINEDAHLHEQNQIPLWVFQKALPQRFAHMTGSRDEFVFQ